MENNSFNHDNGFNSPIYDGSKEEAPTLNQGSQQVLPTRLVPSKYCSLAPMSLVILAAVLLMVDIGLGVHYNDLKDTHLTPEDTENIANELSKLQDTYKAAIKSTNDYKHKMDKELGSQKQTYWELDHQTKRMTEYGPKIAKAKVDITALKQHLLNVENGCKLCPPDWIWINSVCYLIPFTGKFGHKSWPNARQFCKTHGGDLAILDSKDKENATINYLHHHLGDTSSGFWIGLRKADSEGTWEWLNGKTLVEGYWMDREPNSADKDICAAVYPQENFFKAWGDTQCETKMRWICEKTPAETS